MPIQFGQSVVGSESEEIEESNLRSPAPVTEQNTAAKNEGDYTPSDEITPEKGEDDYQREGAGNVRANLATRLTEEENQDEKDKAESEADRLVENQQAFVHVLRQVIR